MATQPAWWPRVANVGCTEEEEQWLVVDREVCWVHAHCVPHRHRHHRPSTMSTPEDNTPLDTSKIITDEHVRQVVRADKGPEAQLSSWGTEDFTEKGDNYTNVITSLKVVFILQGKQETCSYVVKINPKGSLFPKSLELSLMLFEKEKEFYSELSPALDKELKGFSLSPLNVPKCYLTDLESHHELIFLEDLRLRGFRMYDRKKGLDQAHTSLILQELARLHAASLLLQANTLHTDLAHRFPYLKFDYTNASPDGAEAFRAIFTGSCEVATVILSECEGYESAAMWAKNAIEDSPLIFDKQMKREAPFEVLCHGDSWKNNVLFRYSEAGEPVEVMLLDLQCCRVASPATDLSFLLYSSLDGQLRKDRLDDFLTTYYNTFTSVLEVAGKAAPFTLSQLRQEYAKKEELGILWGILIVTSLLEGESNIADYEDIKHGYYDKLINRFKESPTDWMKSNECFRSRFLPLFDSIKGE